MPLKSDWQNGDLFTPAAANAVADAVNNFSLSNTYSTTLGNGSSTSITVTHNLGTMDFVTSVHLISTGEEVECDVVKTTGNTVTLGFATAPAANSLRLTIIGTAFGIGGALGPTTSTNITDATATGRALVTAADAAAARSTIGIATSTSTALGVGSIELGHASDTTLTRSAAGVLAVEGVNVVTTGGALGTPASGTLTNCTGLPSDGVASTLSGKTFISGSASTATAAGTTTLSISDAQVQVFTGSTTQIVKLPTTSVVAGQTWTVINNSSGAVTVQSSGANALVILASSKYGTFTAAVDTPTTAANWRVSSPTDGLSVNSIAQRDSNGWIFANGFVPFRSSTATAAGTTTLAVTSNQVQVFTGSTTQTVKLPTTGIYAGAQYTVINQSSGNVTVQSSGSNTISTLTGGTLTAVLFIALKDTPTAATDWRAV
jgi:hypothetical protein